MELSFILDAARRYWWLVALLAILGSGAGFLASGDANDEFESRAILLVLPARDARVQINVTAANERYVLGQLSVLRSGTLAEEVASSLGDGTAASDLLSSLSVHHIPRTDIVELAIRTPDPERSEEIANAYAESYLAMLRAQVGLNTAPEVEQLDEQLGELRRELAVVDEEIGRALAPYLAAATEVDGAQIPTPQQVAPSLASQHQILLAEVSQLSSTRNEIVLGSPMRVATEIIEPATRPIASVSGPDVKLVLVAGLLVGGFLGMVAAVLVARLSPRVLSASQVGERLGPSVIGAAAWPRTPTSEPAAVAAMATREQRDLIAAIRVRAETTQRPGEGLRIVVAGAERDDNVRSLAALLAASLAGDGLATLLIDAERDPSATSGRDESGPGWSELIEGLREHRTKAPALSQVSRPTRIDGLRVMGPVLGRGQLQRLDLELLEEYADMATDAAVIEVGYLMDSATGLQLARQADTVVLVVSRRTTVASLDSARRFLTPSQVLVLPVWCDRRRARFVWPRLRSDRPDGVDDALSADEIDIADDADVVDDRDTVARI